MIIPSAAALFCMGFFIIGFSLGTQLGMLRARRDMARRLDDLLARSGRLRDAAERVHETAAGNRRAPS